MSYKIIEIRDKKAVVYPETTNPEIARKYFRIFKKDFLVWLLERNEIDVVHNLIEGRRKFFISWRDKRGEDKFYSLFY